MPRLSTLVLALWTAALAFPTARAEKPDKKEPDKKEAARKEADKKPDGAAEKKEVVKTVAQIRLSGDLDETPPPADPLFGGLHENFKAKLDRFTKAQKDANVHALLLDLDGLQVGWGKLDELTRAVTDF